MTTVGKLHHKAIDLTDRKFGALTAIYPDFQTSKRTRKLSWYFRCDCGRVCVKVGIDVTSSLRKGRFPNCGCLTSSQISKANSTHRLTAHPLYGVWNGMKQRCHLPSHPAFFRYGGRGIFVCDRWRNSFEAFWDDMSPTWQKGLDLDRRDNNQGYSPENCRWVSRKENNRNRRSTVYVETPQGIMTVAKAGEVFGIKKTTLHYRIKHGWPMETMFREPDVTTSGCTTS